MNDDPATKGDLEQLRQEMHQRFEMSERALTQGLEGHRQQQSAEHGSLFGKLSYITEIAVWVKTWMLKVGRVDPPGKTWPGDKK
jgi:hypothetical protein